MASNAELLKISKTLKDIFEGTVWKQLKGSRAITDRTLDIEVLECLKNVKINEPDFKLRFSKPIDVIYKAEKGRTPYDILSYGIINNKRFKVFINNKFGNLYSKARNDITTYNNLLRLYLNIYQQRIKKITIDKNTIYKRILGKEIIGYGVFVFDKEGRGSKFFLLEEVNEEFYINPRNTMFQIKYNPNLVNPVDYYSFIIKLIDSVIDSLAKSKASIETEIIVLKTIKQQIIELKESKKK